MSKRREAIYPINTADVHYYQSPARTRLQRGAGVDNMDLPSISSSLYRCYADDDEMLSDMHLYVSF